MTWHSPDKLDPTNSHRVMVHHPAVFHADFNADAIAEAVLFPRNDNGTWTAECAVWNNDQDCFCSITVNDVRRVRLLPKPPAR
jgi:hypothetical protein